MSEESHNIKSKVHRSLAWVGMASSMVGMLDIFATILLVAFWIPPDQYGIAALIYPIFPVLDTATDLGLASAVIQRDNHSKSRISTVFWLNFGMSILLFAVLVFGVGPLLAWLHGHTILASLLTLYAAKLIWQNVYALPQALMKRDFRFKEISIIRVIANLAEFASKVGFAAAGFGLWCFIAGPLARSLVTGIGVQYCNPWRPALTFRFKEGWDWAKFGLKTSAHQLLFRLYSLADKQVVGIYFDDVTTGIYAIAYRIVLEPAVVISEVTINVAFPAFARLKHDSDKLFEQLVSFCKMNLLIMLLFVGFTFVAAEEILQIFSVDPSLGQASGATIIRLLCGVAVLRSLSFVIPPFLDGVGRPTLTLIYTSVAAVVLTSLFVLFASLFGPSLGAVSVALAWFVGYPIAFALLVLMAFAVLGMPSSRLYARLAGVLCCGLAATFLAGAAKMVTIDLPLPFRLGSIVIVMLGSYSVLLGRFQNISLRSVRSSLG